MSLEQKVNDELKAAIKSGDKIRMETLRSLRASIIEFNKSGAGRTLNEDDEIKMLKSAVKKRKDAIEMFDKGGRKELAEKENKELQIISEFLPKQLTEEEVASVVSKIISETGAEGMKDMGKVMGQAMKEMKGIADGSIVQKLVKEGLEK